MMRVQRIEAKPKLASAIRLNQVETEVIDFFIKLFHALGQPRSFAEVYGLLFISPVPLCLNDVEERLEMSRGSAFQGLQFLEELGALRALRIPGDRRKHFAAELQLSSLVGGLLRQQVLLPLRNSPAQLQRITKKAEALTGEQREVAVARAKTLKNWACHAEARSPVQDLQHAGSRCAGGLCGPGAKPRYRNFEPARFELSMVLCAAW